MSFVVSTKEVAHSKKVGEVYVKGDYHRYSGGFVILKGTPRCYTRGQIINQVIEGGVESIPTVRGEFSVIHYDIKSRVIEFTNDKLGREYFFYFWKGQELILSDDFWEIINIIEPEASDIDGQSVKELAVFRVSLSYKTIIRNLQFFPPASLGRFSFQEHELKISSYWDFHYEPNEDLTIDDAIERLDARLDEAIKRIKDTNPSGATYGLGLSGGLDSRLVPHYTLKHGMVLRFFIIGEKRPHKFLLSRDHASARQLARYYGLQIHEVAYDSDSFDAKGDLDVRKYPLGPSNFFIAARRDVPEFDILLNGMNGGEMLGSTFPSAILELNNKDLLERLLQTFTYMYKHKRRSLPLRLVGKLTKKIVGRNPFKGEVIKRQTIPGVITEKEFAIACSTIEDFINDNAGKSNIDIWQKYLFFTLASRNGKGAFGSLHGRQKSYCVFSDPWLFEEALTWKPEFLIGRRLQTRFYVKKFPDLAKIKAQDAQPAVFYRDQGGSTFKKIVALVEFLLRGNGVTRYADWAWEKKYRDYSRKILLRDNKIFNQLFDVEKIMSLGKEDMRLYENIVKIKRVLDVIETKEYRKFVDSNANE